MTPLQGLNVLITGASAGIGAALARELARHGANLLLAARRTKRLEQLCQEIGPDRAAFSVCNVTCEEDLKLAVETMNQKFGPIDIAIANAGFAVGGKLEDLTPEDYQRQFETNVGGVIQTVYAVLADLKKTRGRLVIIGSVNGYVATPGASAYAMSKFAVRALAESLTHELSPHGVSVTHVAPGCVKSEIRQVDRNGVFHAQPTVQGPRYEMDAATAAKHITRAIAGRKREVIITHHGKVLVWMARHCSGLMAIAFAWRAKRRAKAAAAADEVDVSDATGALR